MKKYFFTDGTNKFGPYTLDELKGFRITKQTKVWFEELSDWTPAGDIYELHSLLETMSPPPFNNTSNQSNYPPVNNKGVPPKNWLLESILITLFCCLPLGIVSIVNASKVDSRYYAGDITGADNAAKEAKKWVMISFWIGLAFGIIYLIFLLIAGVSGF